MALKWSLSAAGPPERHPHPRKRNLGRLCPQPPDILFGFDQPLYGNFEWVDIAYIIMANRIKSYIPAPTRDSPPEGPILLGNIIASPDVPEECLNKVAPSPIMNDVKPFEAHKIRWKDSTSKHSKMSGGIFAQVLQVVGLGGDIGGGRTGSSSDGISAERVDTYWFNPKEENINASIEDPGVKAYLVATKHHHPIFLITGIMVARGASAIQTSMKGNHFQTQIGVDLTSVGAPVTMGPKGSVSHGHEREFSFDKASDFVLAYRLMKIRVTRKAEVSSKRYHEGALHSTSEMPVSEEQENNSYITTVVAEDVGAKDLNGGGIEIIEGDDKSVEIV
jgi:hypothetical protein